MSFEFKVRESSEKTSFVTVSFNGDPQAYKDGVIDQVREHGYVFTRRWSGNHLDAISGHIYNTDTQVTFPEIHTIEGAEAFTQRLQKCGGVLVPTPERLES